LTKRVKKCKECTRKIIAPNELHRVNMLMNLHIPKVTIYRIGKFDHISGSREVDLMLLVRNPNDSRAEVSFKALTQE